MGSYAIGAMVVANLDGYRIGISTDLYNQVIMGLKHAQGGMFRISPNA